MIHKQLIIHFKVKQGYILTVGLYYKSHGVDIKVL